MSYKVAEALALVELPFIHVSRALPPPPGTRRGHAPSPDSKVAKWCGQTSYVLVTIDTDFHTRWIKSGLLRSQGVEVIVFASDLKGLQEQHHRITRHYPAWQSELGRNPYMHRVWRQDKPLTPKLMQGQKARRRSRQPRPIASAPPAAQSSIAAQASASPP